MGMIGVWMTPCKNGRCELSVRRDGTNKLVIASQTPLTDAQAEELFWCIGAMQRSGKTLKDLLKEQEAVVPILIREARNKNYNDYVCPRCDNEVVYEQNYCSECGVKFMWEGR